MSLKGFHILLISLSTLLAVVFGGWSLHAWRTGGAGSDLAWACLSFALAAVLAVYVVWFARKIRSRDEEDRRRRKLIQPLAIWLAASLVCERSASACSACYSQASGPMIDAARWGVWLLFGLVFAVQVAFLFFFLSLRRRARDAEEYQH